MLDAWLDGDVPHEVMADWCEERGIAFPRLQRVNLHRTAATTRSASTSRSGRTYASRSACRMGHFYVSESRCRRRVRRVASKHQRWR